ncbi:MAG TPA: hypothetical protein VKG80_16850 [Trebonia sp.]|nr:hypothetical protein [Trebonia sp.]
MIRLDINAARCEALFSSGLQESDALTAASVTAAISGAVRRYGVGGCVRMMAQEFGDHPEAARDRMRWVRRVVGELIAAPVPRQAGASGRPVSGFALDTDRLAARTPRHAA